MLNKCFCFDKLLRIVKVASMKYVEKKHSLPYSLKIKIISSSLKKGDWNKAAEKNTQKRSMRQFKPLHYINF